MDKEINLIEIAFIVLKKLKMIIIITILFGALMFVYSYNFIMPKYVSRGMIYVDNSTLLSFQTELAIAKDVQYSDMVAAQRLATIYAEILKSSTFLQSVNVDSDTNLGAAKIGSIMNVAPKNNTEILEITVTYTNPHTAAIITETILNKAKTEIPRIFKGGSVEIIDHANIPTRPSSPNHIKNTLLGLILGFIISIVLAFLIELLDNRVKNQDDLISKYDYPVLGSIPSLGSIKKITKHTVYEPNGRATTSA